MAAQDSTATQPQSVQQPQSIPFLHGVIEQIPKTRRQLDYLYRDLELIQATTIVCGAALSSHYDKEVELVLRRGVSDRVFELQKLTTQMVERFGGRTSLSGRDTE